ncbi:MAG: G8 domain-containing protein [Planctomycetota bacterium]|nr:G8 domain-containing protein [Planctomycetota bacterium]
MFLRIFLLCSLASPALALRRPYTQLPLQDRVSPCFIPPPGAALWSDPASWLAGVPGPGDCVTIQVGTTMYLDTSSAALGGLSVQGELVMLCGDYTITSDWIQVTGLLKVGDYGHRFHHQARIVLTDDWDCTSPIISNEPVVGTVLGPPVMAVQDAGVLRLIGADTGASWTRLATTAWKDQNVLKLLQSPGWKPGQRIVIASTDFDMNQAEEHVIESIAGDTITLTQNLTHTHWGETEGQSFDGSGIEERAEVALLDRNVIVEGVQVGGANAGHTLVMESGVAGTPRGELDSVELRYLGNQGALGRYPVHFHHVGNATGSFVRNCSIHETYNRANTLHMSQNVEATGNVSYDCLGHAFFFEDTSVMKCVVTGNLGLSTKATTTLPSDARPATFWVHNPQNLIDDNAAAGSEGVGFWFETDHGDPSPWASFSGNVAHSNDDSGFMQDERRPAPQPASVYKDLTAYKNRRFGIWLRTYGEAIISDGQFADNRCGVYFASEGFQFNLFEHIIGGTGSTTGISKAWLLDSLVIGETANVGLPLSCEEQLAGRSLPQKSADGGPLLPAWTTLAGVEIYDGFIGIEDCVFAEFRDKSLSNGSCSFDRKAGALHQVFHYNPWSVDPRNSVRGLSFINDASTTTRGVYMRTPQGIQPPWWCTSTYNLDDGGLANVILQDKDGCLGTSPGSSVYPINPFLDPTSGATLNADWNAMVTGGPPATPYAQLDFAQLYYFDPDSTVTLDGKPVLAFAGLHALLRNQWFVKGGPVLDICDVTTERPIPRIVTNVITDDVYEYYYDPVLPTTDWPEQISISLQFTEPGRWVYVTIPLAALPPAKEVIVNGEQATMAPDAQALYTGPGNEWWYDAASQRIHLKIITGGSGSTVDDGERSTFVVNYP